jgi:hypothetical protein
MNNEWKKRRIREDFVTFKVEESIDLKINIFLDDVAYSILNFKFSPVICTLFIASTCVSNHTILETVCIFPIGC